MPWCLQEGVWIKTLHSGGFYIPHAHMEEHIKKREKNKICLPNNQRDFAWPFGPDQAGLPLTGCLIYQNCAFMAMCVSLQAIFVRKKQVSLSHMDRW